MKYNSSLPILIVAIVCNVVLTRCLLDVFIIHNFMSYVDVHSYIEYGRDIASGALKPAIVPIHYWLRIVIPYLAFNDQINDAGLWIYAILNVVANILSLYAFIIGLQKLLHHNLVDKTNNNVIIALAFMPGLLFSTVTMKPEWPSVLIIGVVLWLTSHRKIIFSIFALAISIFGRPSVTLTALILIIINRRKNHNNIKTIFIVTALALAIGAFAFNVKYKLNFFESAYYNPLPTSEGIREYLQIHEVRDIWKLPLKYILSLSLESNLFSKNINWVNPESINIIAGFVRVCALLMIFLSFKKMNEFNSFIYREILSVYVAITLPPIALIGFYQTRYLICGDILLFICLYHIVFIVKKND